LLAKIESPVEEPSLGMWAKCGSSDKPSQGVLCDYRNYGHLPKAIAGAFCEQAQDFCDIHQGRYIKKAISADGREVQHKSQG
jgi:hypothetical protein